MQWRRFVAPVLAFAMSTTALAQLPTYNLGRTPTEEDVRALDLVVGPAGKELPPGKGTAKEGATIFAKKCVACHGRDGEGTKLAPRLVKLEPMHPFATTIWSFINTAMPRSLSDLGLRAELLSANEVYALTAFILHKNGIIREDAVLDEQSLPRIKMPTRDRLLDGLAPRAENAKK